MAGKGTLLCSCGWYPDKQADTSKSHHLPKDWNFEEALFDRSSACCPLSSCGGGARVTWWPGILASLLLSSRTCLSHSPSCWPSVLLRLLAESRGHWCHRLSLPRRHPGQSLLGRWDPSLTLAPRCLTSLPALWCFLFPRVSLLSLEWWCISYL